MMLWMRDRENFEKGREEGREQGRQEGRREAMVKVHQELGMTKVTTLEALKRELKLSDTEAMEVLERYWKEQAD